jgi:uncharacterized protein (TIGR03435 family)
MLSMENSLMTLALSLRALFRLAVVAALCAQAVAVSAQSAPRDVFDVVSVRRNSSGTTQQSIVPQANGVSFVNVQLRAIIQLAYGIPQPARLVGLPAWVNDRYDIVAKTDTPVSPATLAGMSPKLQVLLADRFKPSAKVEQRALDAYALVLARRDGQRGPGLERSTVVCAGRATPGAPAPAPAPMPGAPAPVQCGPRPGGAGRFVFVGSDLSLFASVLSLAVGRSVVDRTGLTDKYDIGL